MRVFSKEAPICTLGCFAYREKESKSVVIYAFSKLVIIRVGAHLCFFKKLSWLGFGFGFWVWVRINIKVIGRITDMLCLGLGLGLGERFYFCALVQTSSAFFKWRDFMVYLLEIKLGQKFYHYHHPHTLDHL